MVTIASRASWGAQHENGDLTLLSLAAEVSLHHSATANLAADASLELERAAMRDLERIGEARFGRGISYNVLVFPSGRAYQGVSFNRRGTHTGGKNSTVRSVCFVGNFEVVAPTAAALATAAAIIAEGRGKWWRQDAPVRPHSHYKATACPGRHVVPHLAALAAGTAGAGAAPAPSTPTPAPAPAPAPSRVLEVGSRGARVEALQLRLKTRYPLYAKHLVVDGVYGPKTEAVVAEFQRRAKLKVDGVAGPATHAALGLAY